MTVSPDIDVVLEPPMPCEMWERTDRPGRCGTLESFGLDPDRPVVVVGHQPTFWHAGILAKFMAADALAERCDGQLVHLVLDGHRGPFGVIEWPEHGDDGSLRRGAWRFRETEEHVPMALQPPCDPSPCPVDAPSGVEHIRTALRESVDAPNAACQQARALDLLMDSCVGPRTTITTSAVLESPAGVQLSRRMEEDFEACRRSYNAAIAEDPTLGIAPLESGQLPLWSVDERSRLRTAHVDDAAGTRRFPKALCTTALARLGLGDCFVHGLGGGRYDSFMESWIESWLHQTPCPMVVASATVLLPLGTVDEWRSVRQQRIALARRRRHDPALLRGSGLSTAKAALLQEIGVLPMKSPERRAAFQHMHDTLLAHPAAGDGLLSAEEELRLKDGEALATCRTWAFPLHEAQSIRHLREAVRQRVVG